MKPLSRAPETPRKLRSNDVSLGYDEGRAIPARAPPPPSTPASQTANVIRSFLESGPRSRQEVIHHLLIRSCEEGTLDDALALLGCVEKPTMFLPGRGLVMMTRLPGQRIEKIAYDDLSQAAPRGQRRPRHLGDRKL